MMRVKKYIENIGLAVIILAQIFTYIFIFSFQKTSFHEDEYFSYGLANSCYKPFLYGSEFKKFDNYNTWLSGDDFKNYIQTNDNTAFSYGSVYSNQAKDTMPPLYYIIIHTISSIFKNRFSWWYGFCVNLIAFTVTQIFLYMIFSKLSKSKIAGILTCALFGFSIVGQNIQLFIRMYSMLTMFAVMFVFFAQEVLISVDNNKKNFIFAAAVTFLGAMTHHLFLIFAFIYTFLQCIYLFVKKEFKKMFAFGLAALTGVVVSFAAFLPSVEHIFFRDMKWSADPDVLYQIKTIKNIILNEIFGSNEIFSILWPIICFCIVYLIIVDFVLRKGRFVKRFAAAIWERTKAFIKDGNFTGIFSFVTAAVYIAFISGRFYYFDIMQYADRYVFIVMPFLCGVIITAVCRAVVLIPKRIVKNILMCIVCAMTATVLIYQNIQFDSLYANSNNAENGSIREYVGDSDCILLLKSSIFLPCCCSAFAEADDVFVSLYAYDNYKTQQSEYEKIFNDNDMFYLAFDLNGIKQKGDAESMFSNIVQLMDEDVILNYFEDISKSEYKYCTKENMGGITMKLYRFEKLN